MRLTEKERASGWMAFWGLTGYFIGYEASAFANGHPLDFDLMHLLGAGSLATLVVVLRRSRAS